MGRFKKNPDLLLAAALIDGTLYCQDLLDIGLADIFTRVENDQPGEKDHPDQAADSTDTK